MPFYKKAVKNLKSMFDIHLDRIICKDQNI